MKSKYSIGISVPLLLIIFTCFSCTRIVSIALGVRKPRVETIESITRFCLKKGIDTTDLLVVKTNYIESCFDQHLNKDYLFDKNGYQLSFNAGYSDSACGGNILKTIKAIPPVSYMERDSLKTLDWHKKKWVMLNDTLSEINIESSDIDYIIVSYWNMFCGSPNHKKRFEFIKEYTAMNKSSKFKHILVNQDIRDIEGEVIMLNGKRAN